jgi:Flp pilus assembly protein TadD
VGGYPRYSSGVTYSLAQARRLVASGDSAGALRAATQAVQDDPSDDAAWLLKATMELALRRPHEAAASARRAAELSPAAAKHWHVLGGALSDAGQFEDARQALERATSLSPAWAAPWVELGTACLEAKDAKAAANALERALEIDPAQPRAWNNLGRAYLDERRVDDAESAFKRALALQPDYALAFANLARVAALHGDAARERDYLTLARRLSEL